MTTEQDTQLEDTSSDQIDDVKKFMEEQGIAIPVDESAAQEVPAQEETEPASAEEESPNAVQEELLQEEAPDDDDEYDPEAERLARQRDIQLAIDEAYANDALEEMSNLYKTTVKGFEYKITDDEKEAYLRCMLNDTPVILTVTTLGSDIDVTCRGLSVYEIELATYAGIQFVKNFDNQKEMAELMWKSEIQKYRLTMQLMKFQSTMYDYLTFSPEPGKLDEHCAKLRKVAAERFGAMNIIKWKMCIHALNIFEHKLTRLNELALMPDFLSPGESD